MRATRLVEDLALLGGRVVLAEGVHGVHGDGATLDEAVGDNVGEVDDALGVAPLVVVPGDNLDHVVAHDHGEGGVDGGGDVGAAEVDGDEGGLGDGEDALHVTLGGLLEGGVHLLGGEALLLDVDHEVDDGDVGGGHAERDAVELALELGKDERDSLGGAGGGGHDVERGGAGAAEVAVGRVEDALVTGVGVAGGHGTLDDAELVVEHLGEGREAVGGAGRVGHNVGGGVVVIRVHADDVGGDVVALGGGGDDNLLGASLDVLAGAGAVEEDTGALDDDVDLHLLPGEVEGVAIGHDGDVLAVDGDGGVIDNLHVGVEGAEDGVVLEEVSRGLGAAGLVDADDLEGGVGAAGHPAADEVAACALVRGGGSDRRVSRGGSEGREGCGERAAGRRRRPTLDAVRGAREGGARGVVARAASSRRADTGRAVP